MVPGSKMRAKEGDQIRIELPRLQERLFPEMFAKLEEEKQMKFVKDFRLTYGVLEETFQKTEQEHMENLLALFERISEYGFKVRIEKCSFAKPEIRYLGFIVDRNGRRPNPEKIEAIKGMVEPKNVGQLRAFLGMITYYAAFMPTMKDLRGPLDALLKKDVKWEWTSKQLTAFEKLKKALSSELNLAHCDPRQKIVVAADACDYGIGCVISHRYADGSEKPIAHASRSLTAAEKNYSQIEKEALGIVFAVKKFHKYVFGRKFLLLTDHKPLLAIFGDKKGVPVYSANRLMRWATILLGYDFDIEYVNTTKFGQADGLSRLMRKHQVEDEDIVIASVENDVGLLLKECIRRLPVTVTDVESHTKNDPVLRKVILCVNTGKWPKENQKLAHFQNRRETLSVVGGCLIMGEATEVKRCTEMEPLGSEPASEFRGRIVMRRLNAKMSMKSIDSRSENVKLFWPMDWPWVVGAVVIKEVASNGMGAVAKEIEYLFPRYVFHSDLLMMQVVSDVYFMSGGLKMSVGFEMRLRKEKYDRSDFVLAPFIMMLTHILITSSFTIIPAEEQNSHFKHLSFDVPYGNDVIEERARVTRPSGFGTILVVKSLVKFRKNVCAVKNFTFGLDKGDVFGLVGMMGSGKSTTFNLISGVERPSSGKVLIHGKRPYKLPMMGFCAQYDSLFPALTCRQNIIIIAGMLGYRSVRKKADKLIGYLGLRLHAGRVIAHCSEGQKRRISVALALLTRADVIVMDEPTRGVDPIARRDIWKLIRTTQLNDRTLFFTTSSIEECEMLGTRYGVLCKGRFVSTGPMEVLKEHRSKLCVLQLELMDKKKKQKVLDTVHDVFPKSVPLPTPESTKQILKWHVIPEVNDCCTVLSRFLATCAEHRNDLNKDIDPNV
ncbi:ABC transporter, ATP-binding protein [Ancylostoma ceylanicum]|uniref:RNA-directed DNA polymerase n=1 Tax=Ancylostoma ceylanicum TaxID=53326 RepID=A0A0D6LZU4_9BILA|nr:ABC transporter, ATP-binding protein [Ancylostoma ceylanicum]